MMAIFRRELQAFFLNPTGYVFLGFFLLVTGVFFAFGNIFGRSSDFPHLVSSVHFVFVIAVPILTMRLFSEEMRQKTDQLLLTCPITVTSIIVGKYLAALTVFFMVVIVTALYAVVIAIWGDLSVSQSIGAMIGFVFAGACYVAIGLMISTLTDNQAVSAAATFAVLLLIQLVDPVRSAIPPDRIIGLAAAAALVLACGWAFFAATQSAGGGIAAAIVGTTVFALFHLFDPYFFHGFVYESLGLFSIVSRQQRFVAGIVSLEDVVFMFSAIFVVLFLSIRFVEKRRWA